MEVRPLTAADGTPLGFSGDSAGALMSLVCPNCRYAELRAAPAEAGAPAAPPSAAPGAEPWGQDLGRAKTDAEERQSRIREAIALAGDAIGESEPDEPGVGKLILLFITAFFATTGVIWIFMASGPVMEAGGFVAKGGPYVIAHQAEDWIWLPTVGATLMAFAAVGNFLAASSLSRPATINLLVFWAGLFGLNSYEFFKYGFHAPGGGISVTWIVLGFMFALMALPALLVLLIPSGWRGFSGTYAWANVLGLVSGLAGGLWIWHVVAG